MLVGAGKVEIWRGLGGLWWGWLLLNNLCWIPHQNSRHRRRRHHQQPTSSSSASHFLTYQIPHTSSQFPPHTIPITIHMSPLHIALIHSGWMILQIYTASITTPFTTNHANPHIQLYTTLLTYSFQPQQCDSAYRRLNTDNNRIDILSYEFNFFLVMLSKRCDFSASYHVCLWQQAPLSTRHRWLVYVITMEF